MSNGAPAKIEVQGVVKRFGGVAAVDGLSFHAREGEVLGLLGPSGCGKTTVLRSISGLEVIDEGQILLDGAVVTSPAARIFVPPEKRHLGFVFQSYALWPHMTVKQNVAYGLKGLTKEETAKRVSDSLELVGLRGVGDRYPSELSGGQQQRVALARSISYQPKVLLLDEPLSNLDQKERERVRGELRALLNRIGITTILVTHDQEEAFVVCDRVVLMNRGRIEQEGTPDSLYGYPANLFVAEFIGRGNVLKAELATLDPAGGRAVLKVPEIGADLTCEFDGELPKKVSAVVIRRNEMGFSRSAPDSQENVLKGQVVAREYRGAVADHKIRIGDAVIVATTHRFEGLYETKVSDTLYVHIPPRAIKPIAG